MNRASAVKEAWHPATPEERQAVRTELEAILASPHFCNSRRYPALLRYVVEHTLEGRTEHLKERTLGINVFERPTSYDTNADTVVRYTAGEVRKRLALYYHELGHRTAVHISLPPGSYVPEFQLEPETATMAPSAPVTKVFDQLAEPHALAVVPEPPPETLLRTEPAAPRRWRRIGLDMAIGLAVVLLAGFGWRMHTHVPTTPLNEFWKPVLGEGRTVLVCTGGVVFKEGNFSGVQTAGKDIEYPFVSSQIASGIARLSSLIERGGGATDLQFSASTPITALREQPVVLLGAYNNQWTVRLLDNLPFHFAPEAEASIVSSTDRRMHWARDMSQPYSSADDYAVVARFRDATTDSWNVVVAGLGRNGTEAAAQFATSEHYMQVLRDQVGGRFGERNVEAVLKVNVIEGKTGAPSLVAARAW